MKHRLTDMIRRAVESAFNEGTLATPDIPDIEIEEPKIEAHGDFSTNAAMVMASVQKMPPRKIAAAIVENMEDSDEILQNVDIAGPGFINFHIRPGAWRPVLREIHESGLNYGASDAGKGIRVQVEFVSANPTGPLHVGHGRGAAVGDAVASILAFCGYDVEKEYYINDSGRQIRTLGRSVYLRLKEMKGEKIEFPDDCYQGGYIRELAKSAQESIDGDLLAMDSEKAIAFCARFAAERILDGIKSDLDAFGVRFDGWYSEQSLFDSGQVEKTLDSLQIQKLVYKKDGALWFNTSNFGDEKDRVVVRQNGQTTYFASDIAYHQDKYSRGFDRVIDVWGADHHGYIPRMTALVEASGKNRDQFHVILVQLVNLLRSGEPVAMSTRSGEFVTLRDVIGEVGRDAARFIFLTRHYESPLDFDLELAKKKTNDNPVYYVQYVHARISSIARKGAEEGIGPEDWDSATAETLSTPEEIKLIKVMARYPSVVDAAAKLMEPHRISYYLMELASAFHAYYNKHRVLTDDPHLTRDRLYLVLAVQKVIRNGLTLLGVEAPERM